MLRILLHIFRRKHISNADLKRALANTRRTPDNQIKIIEYQDTPARKQDATEQPVKEEN